MGQGSLGEKVGAVGKWQQAKGGRKGGAGKGPRRYTRGGKAVACGATGELACNPASDHTFEKQRWEKRPDARGPGSPGGGELGETARYQQSLLDDC